ncbi:uncharacterized protein LOC122266021 [Penaeus japonicus]|uniref:uncharacterized protein LOC122266021 n=1 Tax=Penaeus japonicus TaxID=27405 RepID=UPI001C716969|nr:uncharacterized protein LOC122266021 [Penaeus japonicus]XP_042891508.1 uncharacterized protein LOC122266021 [Penaeus japonicus]
MGQHRRTFTFAIVLTTVATLLWTADYLPLPVVYPEKKREPETIPWRDFLYPSFSQKCFAYEGTDAENLCCNMKQYRSVEDIRQCIRGLAQDVAMVSRSTPRTSLPLHSTQKNKEEQKNILLKNRPLNTTNWAFIGDSHGRYLFCAIFSHMKGPEFQCRIPDFQGEWRSLDYFLDKLPSCRYKGDFIEIRHVHSPFTLTYYKDQYLTNLTRLMRQWENNERPYPTFLVMNTGNHWMRYLEPSYLRKGVKAAGKIFEKHLLSVAPLISRLARTATVIFKMQDDLQVAYIRKPKVKSFTVANFREYNAIYRRVLKDTGVVFWDSTLPLSRAYNQECLRNPRHLEDTLLWMCKDVVHVGYILWNQYADMVLNAACGQRMSNCV